MRDKIVQIDAIRIDRNKPRKCVCEVREYTVDTVNREITCGCGTIVDPFEAMADLANHYEQINRQHNELDRQRQEWLKEKPHSVLFKRLEQSYRRGIMLPECPKCNQIFDFPEVTGWHNAQFYRKLQQSKKPTLL